MWSIIEKVIKKIKIFFIRFFHGSKLSLLSLKAYYHYKKLLLLPFIGSILFVLVFMGIGWIGWGLHNHFRTYIDQSTTHKFLIFTPLILLLLFCVACIHVFFNVVAASMVGQYCEQGHASLMSAIARTCKKKKNILFWSCMETVVRATSGRREDESSTSVDIVSLILGTSWSYLSFFIYPIFAFEDKKLFESLKRSVDLTKRYFGSMSGSLFTFSMLLRLYPFILLGYFTLLSLVVRGVAWLLQGSALYVFFSTARAEHLIFFVLMPNLFVSLWFVVEFIALAKTITSTILYRYVNNLPTGIFNRDVLDAAVKER